METPAQSQSWKRTEDTGDETILELPEESAFCETSVSENRAYRSSNDGFLRQAVSLRVGDNALVENSRRDRRTEPIVKTVPFIMSAEDQGILGLSRKLEK